MSKQIIILSAFTLASFALPSSADIYKQVGPDGRITYSNVKTKGATKLDLETGDSNFGTGGNNEKPLNYPPKKASPSDFPKVDSQTQNQRDNKRKDILLQELEQEKQALKQAKQAYAEGESNPEVYRTKDGKTFRNVAKFDEKMKNLQAEVDAHERNIELLNKEISNLN
jgi:hypothetical protein